MQFGVIGFSYGNFARSRRVFDRTGLHSANLGDNVQSLAVRGLYRRLGVPAERVVTVDRDSLRDYDGPPVVLPMNAAFQRHSFPVSPKVTPLWIGFHASPDTIAAHRGWLARQGVIGCRDPATAAALQALGIAAEVTGCLTLSFPARRGPPDPEKGRVLIVHGQGPGALPVAALKTMPEELLRRADLIYQRRDMSVLPLGPEEMSANDRIAGQLLERYRRQAALMVTSLHHAAAPALAMGIPTVVIRNEASSRFGHLERLVRVHVGPDFAGIDWAPAPVDLTAVKQDQWQRFRSLVAPWLSRPAALP